MTRALWLATPLLVFAAATTVNAQKPDAAPAATAQRAATPVNNQNCDQQRSERRQRGRRIGGLLGGAASILGSQVGGVAGTVAATLPVGEILGEAIASLLDCREQQQAATASEEAVRGGVGTTTNWTSESRPNVRGSSVASAEETLADGTHCMTVTDIVIVEGEETRAPKRMCRGPGQARYARV